MRLRSIKKDTHDQDALRHHKDRFTGCTYWNEFHQEMPFFWTAEGCDVPLRGLYRGAHAFLICNGPSFALLDKRPLQVVPSMAMNNGIAACLPRFRPQFWTCVDDPTRFVASAWLDPRITKIVPHAHADKGLWNSMAGAWAPLLTADGKHEVRVRDCPGVFYFHRNEKFHADRFLWEDTINWGNHKQWGGGRSVMLSALRILFLLGFRHVYLLGADFTMTEDPTTWYSFGEKRGRGAVKCNSKTYCLLKDRFSEVKAHFDAAGFHVANCNADSGLDVFPHVPYQDAIREALGWCGGDWKNVLGERTEGMYEDPAKKRAAYEAAKRGAA